jgi:ABC-type glycerol-3-phosphate transport system substrate-binding protein
VSAAGLDPKTPPETWDEAYTWHEKITKPSIPGRP